MSLLAIDVGNTQTHIGYFEGDGLRESWRLATDASATADELALGLAGLFELRGMPLGQVGATIVSSVVPRLGAEYDAMAARYLDSEALIVGPAVRTGMPIRTDAPHEVGADRIVNAVAAYERFGEACVVVDFGTAITYDAISADGEYLGGIIAPGIEISIEALARRAAKLPEVELAEPSSVVGRNTHDSIQAGIVYGFAAQIDGVLERVRGELGEATAAIATGGQAAAIARFCRSIDEVDELLTLTGLRLIFERNRESR
jgi:type III pantothenate kinase